MGPKTVAETELPSNLHRRPIPRRRRCHPDLDSRHRRYDLLHCRPRRRRSAGRDGVRIRRREMRHSRGPIRRLVDMADCARK